MPTDFSVDVESFNKNGYLVIPSVFSAAELEPLRQEMYKLIDAYDVNFSDPACFSSEAEKQQNDQYFIDSGPKISFFLEEGILDKETGLTVAKRDAFNKVGHALHDLNPVFEKWSYSPVFVKLATAFKQNEEAIPAIMESMYLFKSPRVGTPVRPHQDATFVQTNPDTCIGYWVPLEAAYQNNGCLWVVPGSHHAPLERYFNINEDRTKCEFNIKDYKYDITNAVPVEVPAGSIVIIHGRCVHYSLHNHSDEYRHAVSLHMIDTNVTYPKTNWLERPKDMPFVSIEKRSKELYPDEFET